MKKFLIALAAAAVLAVGCVSTPDIPNPPVPPVEPLPPSHNTAERLMWPFLWAGFLGLLGGLIWAVLFKTLRPLMYAGLIAIVPPLTFLILTPDVTQYVGWLVLASGVVLFCLLLYKVYDVIEDDLYSERKERGELPAEPVKPEVPDESEPV